MHNRRNGVSWSIIIHKQYLPVLLSEALEDLSNETLRYLEGKSNISIEIQSKRSSTIFSGSVFRSACKTARSRR